MKNVKWFLALVFVLSFSSKLFAQDVQACTATADGCAVPVITNLGTVNGCSGGHTFTPSVNPSGQTITSYSWSPSSGVTLASGTGAPGSTTISIPTSCTTYNLTINSTGPQLIRNGGFVYEYDDSTHTCFNTFYGNGCCGLGCSFGHLKVGGFNGCPGCVTAAMPAPPLPYDSTLDVFSHTNNFYSSLDRSLCIWGMTTTGVGVPYFWGQWVKLCAGATYHFEYYVRLMSIHSSTSDLPKFELFLGGGALAGGVGTGSTIIDYSPAFGSTYLGSCASSWDGHTVTFTAPGTGTYFICLNDRLRNGAKYAVDDISLYRTDVTTGPAITICPVGTPTVTITSPANACVGGSFLFTLTGNPGDVIYYNLSGPGCSPASSVTIPGGGSVTVSASSCLTATGTLCLNVTSIITALGPCTYPVTISRCVPIYTTPTAGTISAPTSVCMGDPDFTVSLSGSTGVTGYSWTCTGSGSIVPPATGSTALINIGSTGTINIGCTVSNACGTASTSTNVTVHPIPNAGTITGPTTVCIGTYTTLSDAVLGGTWSSSNPSVATVTSTGDVFGVAVGTAWITYTITGLGACQGKAVALVTVITTPLPITGPLAVCAGGSTIILSDATPGGTWSSSSPTIGSIDSLTGVVTGLIAGVITITYTNMCGPVTRGLTVNPLPAVITGPTAVCYSFSITLSDATAGGAWSSLNTAVAVVDPSTGEVTGTAVLGDTVTIVYTIISTGCYVTTLIKVNPLPNTIDLCFTLCVGSTHLLISGPPGGIWSSSAPGVASIGTGGLATCISAGTTVITYLLPTTGCYVTCTSTVLPLPTPIVGITTICAGGTTTLSDGIAGGTWTSSNTVMATIDPVTGVATGGSTAGTVTITYTLPGTLCYTTTTLTVLVLMPITGPYRICEGDTITYTESVPGGTWSSSDPTNATIDPITGDAIGVSDGVFVITYTHPAGCFITRTISVYPMPHPIWGVASVCVGLTTTLANYIGGGTYASGTTSIATAYTEVSTGKGIVTGVVAGTALITYDLYGCAITIAVTVNPLPVIGVVTGYDTLCVGSTTTLSDTTAGGRWSCSGPYASVDSITGVVTGNIAGTAIITYTSLPNTFGCRKKMFDTVYIIPPIPPIFGKLRICIGTPDTLYNAVAGGIWSSSNTTVATIGSTTGIVTGLGRGSATITYTATGPCGIFTATTTIVVNGEPYLTSNIIVGCPDESSDVSLVIHTSGCRIVCDSTLVRYYANGSAGSSFTWTVSGGTLVNDYGDSVDIFFGAAGTYGVITLYDTANHCSGVVMSCVQVKERPHAAFSASALSICLNDNIVFTNLSTADSTSPIVSWFWDFGDGGYSSIASPTHTYTAASTYTVTLVVRNACNCTDTVRRIIDVNNDPGPKIQCPSVVCDSEYAVYSTAHTCPSGPSVYNWSVSGGTIVSGTGSTAIIVFWDQAAPDGFGYVRLAVPCASSCSDTTTIRVPVILRNATIEGPDTICEKTVFQYSLPLWPATEYEWGVLGFIPSTTPVYGINNDYKVDLLFKNPGIYTLHGRYHNKIKLCGGNVFKQIVVLPHTDIMGRTAMCKGDNETYSLAGGDSGNWKLYNLAGTVIASGSGTSFTRTFAVPGIFRLVVKGTTFCTDPVTITIKALPPPVDSVIGYDTVCLNRVYSYRAATNVPGTIYSWNIVGGTLSPIMGTDLVNVTWTSPSTKELMVKRIGVDSLHCEGPQTLMSIEHELITPFLTGSVTLCANSLALYDANYTRGESYTWHIYPSSAGSLASAPGYTRGPTNSILWNNVPAITTASVVVTITKCDSTVSDTLLVTITPTAAPWVSATTFACPGDTVHFTAASGGDEYIWDFGDGSPFQWGGTNITHIYPANAGSVNVTYTVQVHVTPDVIAPCPLWGIGSMTINIRPSPVATILATRSHICAAHTIYSSLLTADVSTNVSGFTYQWYNASGPMSGRTYDTCTVTSAGRYYVKVTASNGCSDFGVRDLAGCGGGAGPIYSSTCTPVNIDTAVACNGIVLSVPSPGAGLIRLWTAVTVPSGGDLAGVGSTTTTPAYAQYNAPGHYVFYYNDILPSGVCRIDTIDAYIELVPHSSYRVVCIGGGIDSVYLIDRTDTLSGNVISSSDWTVMVFGIPTPLGTARIYGTTFSAPGTDTIIHTVTVTSPRAPYSFTCSDTMIIVLPGSPSGSIVASTTNVCENEPVTFTATTTAGLYRWDFGDTTSSLVNPTTKAYDWTTGSIPAIFTVTLSVTDTLACTGIATVSVSVYRNNLTGTMGRDTALCPSSIPFTMLYTGTGGTPTYDYLWAPPAATTTGPSYPVSTTGAYWVTVTDLYGCKFTTPIAENIKVIPLPAANIYGNKDICLPGRLSLSGYVGDAVGYLWSSSIATSSILLPTISNIATLTAGTYTVSLTLSELDTASGLTCYSSTMDTVVVHTAVSPTIDPLTPASAIDCEMYHIRLSATAPFSGTFNWSNGVYGPVDDIFAGGLYTVLFTDLNGCIGSDTLRVPMSPETWFPYFPSGCYNVCDQELPITIPGPPGVIFDTWEWRDGSPMPLFGGTSCPVAPYAITAAGEYQWWLYNGLCDKFSDTMHLSTDACDVCQFPTAMTATITCAATPSTYDVILDVYSPGAVYYRLGADIGPVAPFTGTFTSAGLQTLMVTFTTMYNALPPNTVNFTIVYYTPDGQKCVQSLGVSRPACPSWPSERYGPPVADTSAGEKSVASAMMVFPNPTSGQVTISYNYGNPGYRQRNVSIYDALGRKTAWILPDNEQGNWNLNTKAWASGVYIIRMEADGKTLQTQRLVVIPK